MTRLLIALTSLTVALSAAIQLDNGIPAVPEPSTYVMMGAGLGALFFARNRFSKKK